MENSQMYVKYSACFFRCSSYLSISEEHLMGASVSLTVSFSITMGLEIPLLGPTAVQQWDPTVPTAAQ